MSVSLVFVNPGVAGLVPATRVFCREIKTLSASRLSATELGGEPTLAEAVDNGGVAPIPAVRVPTIGRHKSTISAVLGDNSDFPRGRIPVLHPDASGRRGCADSAPTRSWR